MDLHGRQMIGFSTSAEGGKTLQGFNPTTGETLMPHFREATLDEIDAAARLGAAAAKPFQKTGAERRAEFLEAVAEQIETLGDQLIERGVTETALPEARLVGERGRTIGQLKMFADLIREGSWVEARIDTALPDRQPLPRPDLRRMLVPVGPVAVFGASNFPLAFSVAGGDTASAWAAGCPVIVKAHPAHPGVSELVGRAVIAAASACDMPDGVFSMVHGSSHQVGQALVSHPAISAVGFTGSFAGGKALFDLAAQRPEPIPVYAEMGSSNPVFVLPGAARARSEQIAQGLVSSVTLGAGQFCTNPGLTVLLQSEESRSLLSRAAELFADGPACTLVHPSIKQAYDRALEEVSAIDRLEVAARASAAGPLADTDARTTLLETDAVTFLENPRLGEEIYGPTTVAVVCQDREELLELAESLQGHLTATIHGEEEELAANSDLLEVLQAKAGRVIFNGFPTGVEVSPAMQHGGPYPATTDSRSTSVGTAAIQRFVRPVCWQGFPSTALPVELRDENERGIWRLVDGKPTREAI